MLHSTPLHYHGFAQHTVAQTQHRTTRVGTVTQHAIALTRRNRNSATLCEVGSARIHACCVTARWRVVRSGVCAALKPMKRLHWAFAITGLSRHHLHYCSNSICCVGNFVRFWRMFAMWQQPRRSALPCVLFTGPCVFGHSGWCVYIGDIGGNTGAGGENKIFMVREPPSIHDNTLHVLETLRFTYV